MNFGLDFSDSFSIWKRKGDNYLAITTILQHVFALPNSNAHIERLFSLMKTVHTPTRNSLKLETINNMLSIKVNKASPYSIFDFDCNIKKNCKSATTAY